MRKEDYSGIAALLAQKGRNGDTMLVHMNPIEVAGIAALTPKGLTRNPDTGLPEAFNWMETVLPMVAGAAAVAATGGVMAAPLAAGLGSGLTTTALTGDIERGMISGMMGAVGGSAMGNAGEAALGAGADIAGQAGADVAGQAAGEIAGQAAGDMAGQLGTEALAQTAAEVPLQQAGEQAMSQYAQQQAVGVASQPNAFQMALKGDPTSAYAQASPSERLTSPFQARGKDSFASQMMDSKRMLPMAVGVGQYAELNAADKSMASDKEINKKKEADLKEAYGNLQGAYRAAQPGAQTGYSPYRNMMSRNSPRPGGYAEGGVTHFAGGGRFDLGVKTYAIDPSNRQSYSYSQTRGGRGGGWDSRGAAGYNDSGYGGIDPVTVQANLRGAHSVRPPAGFRPGFDPEFDYFQNDPDNIQVSEPTAPQQYAPLQRMQPTGQPYFDNFLAPPPPKNPHGEKPVKGAAAGGIMEAEPMPEGGIANLPQPPAQMPEEADVRMLAVALMGGAGDRADQIVEGFVQKYGPEVFQMLRQMILQSQSPNAQTEGMIKGQGGGMDDQVPGTIGGQQPVAVSPGEYIVPADVVSGLGDGSSDAGAAELDRMRDNVRMARGGTTTQPPPFDAKGILPA